MPTRADTTGNEGAGRDTTTGQTTQAAHPSSSPATPQQVRIDDVLADEREKLGLEAHEQPAALCLSGGGIRSATFSLGVLQGLARLGRLRAFHYISSVSGGSYIALWLAAWIRRGGGIAEVERALEDSIAHGNVQRPVQRLRAYSNFLSPVHGVSPDALAALAICARNLLLHWTMILPIVFAALLLPRILYAWLQGPAIASTSTGLAPGLWVVATVVFAVALVFASYDTSRPPPPLRTTKKTPSRVKRFFLPPVFVASLIVVVADPTRHQGFGWPLAGAIMGVGAVLQAVCEFIGRYGGARAAGGAPASNAPQRPDALLLALIAAATGAVASGAVLAVLAAVNHYFPDAAQRTTLGFPLVLAALAFSNVVRAGLSQRWTEEDVREWWGRASGIVAMGALAWLALSLVVIQIPTWLLRWASTWSGWTAGFAGAGSIALAIITAFVGFWSKHGSDVKEKALGFGRALGLRTMEIAAAASMLVIALALSLALGLVVTNPWVPFPGAEVSPAPGCGAAVGANAPSCSGVCTDAPAAVVLNGFEKLESCDVLRDLAASKADIYCAQADTMCAGLCPERPLPASCNKLVATIAITASAPSADAEHASTQPTSPSPASTPVAADVRKPAEERKIFQQLTAANFALGWLIRHEQSLLARWDWLVVFALGLVAFAVLASYLLGANAFSLNAFYGNRLTRAYLGASRPEDEQRPHPFTGFDVSDNLPLSELAAGDDGHVRLLPVVNTALNLVQPSGDRLEWQERKAESFFLTPYYCGSKTLEFIATSKYAGEKGLSAGRAMAISGAAASPSMGYHSSTFVTLLMAFFNVRLGWWMPNPKRYDPRRTEPQLGIGPVLSEMLSKVGSENRFVYLSDGGHFENLGLYEMVRRRCRTIVLVDAACDPDYQYEDLEDAVRKIRIDLGVSIKFEKDGLLTPKRARDHQRHYCTGVIDYAELGEGLENGHLIYIKPVLSGAEPVDLRRYAATTRNDGQVFPQQPTSDQFFDEAQFESYRELGLLSVLEMFDDVPHGEWPAAVQFKPEEDTTGDGTPQKPLPRWAPPLPSSESSSHTLFGALGSISSLGQAAMIASITAAVTVTGTVALKDSTVTLKDPHVTLSDGGSVKLADTEVSLKPSQTPLEVSIARSSGSLPVTFDAAAVATSVDAFLKSEDPGVQATRTAIAQELSSQLEKITFKTALSGDLIPGETQKQLNDLIVKGNAVILDLREASADLKVAADPLRIQVRLVREALDKVIAAMSEQTTELKSELINLKKKLGEIDATVKGISPRQTVRGSGS